MMARGGVEGGAAVAFVCVAPARARCFCESSRSKCEIPARQRR
jgi:hypothetical protein